MNVNKRLNRLAHWAGEKMGSEVKTNSSEEFRALETEMQLRHEGLERLQRSMNVYVKHLSKRTEEEKEKLTPVAYLGSTMISHGDDFEPDSEFGQCLQSFGRANERVARVQESYATAATSTWLEGLERSLAQMKEYQTARKKLESRRLAYDAAQAKLAKSKKEDFRTEEELRSAKAKYEESSEDVYRRMLDIKEAEADSVTDLTAFLDAELTYYERTRDILVQLKRDWPSSASPTTAQASAQRRGGQRSRTNTINSFRNIEEEDNEFLPVMPIRSRVASASASVQSSPMREKAGFDFPVKPAFSRNMTFEGPTTIRRDDSPASLSRLSRVPTETSIASGRSQLRPSKSRDVQSDVFGDENVDDRYDTDTRSNSPDYATSVASRSASYSRQDSAISASRKMAPPPPPSRSKKPPPPPPLKRSALSTSEIPFA